MTSPKRKTRVVKIGSVKIGGQNPIAIQSMLTAKLSDLPAAKRQVRRLTQAGCEIFRVALPDPASLPNCAKLIQNFPQLPFVADIHFDHRLALAAIEIGIAKIRINPGTLSSPANLKKVVRACQKKQIPLRVGLNAGSLEKNLRGQTLVTKLVQSALRNVRAIEHLGYRNLVVSAKTSSVSTTIQIYRRLANLFPYPLHLGITEAGSARFGILKSAVGLGSLLLDGIGATIRFSLTAKPETEVQAARDLLHILKLRPRGIEVIACPTCGRTEVDLLKIVREVEQACQQIKKDYKVAVMGCAVNGPGEARQADFALVGGKQQFGLFQNGKFCKSVSPLRAVKELLNLIKNYPDSQNCLKPN